MSDIDFKGRRAAYAQGYDRALALGMFFSFAVVAFFVVLVLTNPLGLSYYELDVDRAQMFDCWASEPDPSRYGLLVGYGCVKHSVYTWVVLTSYMFGISIVTYGILTFIPALIAFYLLFNTNRRMRVLDIHLAAQKTLGLLEEEEKK